MDKTKQIQNCERFKNLHLRNGLFILANAWDVSSALVFEQAGFEAVGTTSAGVAATLGLPDGEKLSIKENLELIERICSKVKIPVNADIEAGYGDTIPEILKNVEKFIDAGVAGINIEDENHRREDDRNMLYDITFQSEKISAIKELAKLKGIPIVINGKTDASWLSVGKDKADIMNNTIRRANAYHEAGADCVFVPGLLSPDEIQTLINEIDCPLNIVIKKGVPPVSELNKMGLKRLSMGSGPQRAILGFTKKIATEVLSAGTYNNIIDNEITYYDVKKMFGGK